MPGSRHFTDELFAEKFWKRVDKTSDPSGCWLWTGGKFNTGYGVLVRKNKQLLSHRVAYILSGHKIPEGLHLAHSEHCVGKKHCCNPEHLTPKTVAENMADKIRDGTDNRGENCYNSKLTSQQVLEIRERANELHKDLAMEFGVKRQAITKIINKQRWKHL